MASYLESSMSETGDLRLEESVVFPNHLSFWAEDE